MIGIDIVILWTSKTNSTKRIITIRSSKYTFFACNSTDTSPWIVLIITCPSSESLYRQAFITISISSIQFTVNVLFHQYFGIFSFTIIDIGDSFIVSLMSCHFNQINKLLLLKEKINLSSYICIETEDRFIFYIFLFNFQKLYP